MKIKTYMCNRSWDTDIPFGAPYVKLYTSLKSLKKDRTCYKECGIVEVEVKFKKQIYKGTRL